MFEFGSENLNPGEAFNLKEAEDGEFNMKTKIFYIKTDSFPSK